MKKEIVPRNTWRLSAWTVCISVCIDKAIITVDPYWRAEPEHQALRYTRPRVFWKWLWCCCRLSWLVTQHLLIEVLSFFKETTSNGTGKAWKRRKWRVQFANEVRWMINLCTVDQAQVCLKEDAERFCRVENLIEIFIVLFTVFSQFLVQNEDEKYWNKL